MEKFKSSVIKTIMITGASGFLGRELINRFNCLENYKVIALTSNKGMLLERFQENTNLICFDMNEWENGEVPFDIVDVMIHCAFARTSEGEMLASCLDFTNKLISDAVKKGVGSIINISSQSVYSQLRKLPANENSAIVPESLYAMAKYSSEILISSICERESIPFTNVRLASLVGIGLDSRLTTRFVKNVLESEPIKIVGGQQIISYMDVRDAASGIVALLSLGAENWKHVYNLGVEGFHTIIEIADMVKRIGSQYTSMPINIELEEKVACLNLALDCTQFYSDVSWKPQYDMETIIKTQFEYFKQNSITKAL